MPSRRLLSPSRPARPGRNGFTLVEIMVVVVVIGLLAAIAIPTFRSVERRSQDKTVVNNMRQLAAAADAYFLINGTSRVDITSLIGSNAYIKRLSTVANEAYPRTLRQGRAIIVSGIAGSRTLTYLQ